VDEISRKSIARRLCKITLYYVRRAQLAITYSDVYTLACLQLLVFIGGEDDGCSLDGFTFDSSDVGWVHFDGGGGTSRLLHYKEARVSKDGAEEEQEGFLDMVIRFGTELEVGDVLLAVKDYVLSFHGPFFAIHLVTHEDHGGLPTNTFHVLIPHRDVLVRVPGRYIEKQDDTFAPNDAGLLECM